VGSYGNSYIADDLDRRVRKISNGAITSVAGNLTAGLSGDNGRATNKAYPARPPPDAASTQVRGAVS
jgi:hypothetical protein